MLAAAAGWDGLASELSTTASSYGSTISELTTSPWLGPASMSMAAAAAPYVAWLSITAMQAEQAATQAKVAALAYETAFAMTVPPPVIAANRAQLMLLIATNFLGQNAPAIAATEAHYTEMWAQDAAAMYGYAGSSASASKVTPFSPPPRTTNSAGLAGQAAAVGHAAGTSPGTPSAAPTSTPSHVASALPNTLAQPTSPTSAVTPPAATKPPTAVPPGLTSANNATSFFLSWTNGSAAHSVNFAMRGLFNGNEFPKAYQAVNDVYGGAGKAAAGAAKPLGSAPSLLPGLGGAPVAASAGQGAQVGGMSVPPSFPGAGPGAGSAVAALRAEAMTAEEVAAVRETAAAEDVDEALGGMPGLPGAAAPRSAGLDARAYGFRFVPRYGYRHKVMARTPGAG